MHDIHEFPRCETCDKSLTRPIISIPQGYYENTGRYRFCSVQCACASEGWIKKHSVPTRPETIQKRKETNNKKYGGNGPSCSREVVEKMRATKEARYGDPGYTNHEQAVKTLNERYNVDNPSQVKEFQLKKEATCLKNHGSRYVLCDGEYMKQAFTDKLGVDNPMKVKEIFEKARQTCRDTYNSDYYVQSDEYKARIHEISSKAHKKWLLCWNDDKTRAIFKRGEVSQEELDKWEHVMEFDSRDEISVFAFCKIDHEMNVVYHPRFVYPYVFRGTDYTYCPDFEINGRHYEVKGEQFFRINESTEQEEMFIPWKGKRTDEEYEYECDKENAKYQCMIANNVIILREKDIKNLTLQTFGVGV